MAKYGGYHQRMRVVFRAHYRNGQPCVECGEPLWRWQPWHLCHDHIHGGYKGLGHANCNVIESNKRRVGKVLESSPALRW